MTNRPLLWDFWWQDPVVKSVKNQNPRWESVGVFGKQLYPISTSINGIIYDFDYIEILYTYVFMCKVILSFVTEIVWSTSKIF